jgi:hypothetical protein
MRCLTVVSLLFVTAGCAAATSSSAAPPTVICGTTLSHQAAGPSVIDATGSHMGTVIRARTDDDDVFIVVATGCDRGATATWSPIGDATLVRAANAKNGLPAAIVLRPTKPHDDFTVIGIQDGHVVSRAVVRLKR